MKKINVLTKGPTSPNGIGFLFPLFRYREQLENCGVKLTFFENKSPALTDCDILFVESKVHTALWAQADAALEDFAEFRSKVRRVFYFNIGDSATFDHAKMMPYVDKYLKNQILGDVNAYKTSFYGNRVYTDFYHKVFEVKDQFEEYSQALSAAEAAKIGVSWNYGLADFGRMAHFSNLLFKKLDWAIHLSRHGGVAVPSLDRAIKLNLRMSLNYSRQTVAWQRQKVREKFATEAPTKKVTRKRYLDELSNSLISISPFGWGEINLRDFEVFRAGSLLLKPDMSHMRTWPNFFEAGKTILCHRWDLTDINDVVEDVLKNYIKYIEMPIEAHKRYLRYVISPEAPSLFCDHFLSLIK